MSQEDFNEAISIATERELLDTIFEQPFLLESAHFVECRRVIGRRHAELLAARGNEKSLAEVVDAAILSVMTTHDHSALWSHGRLDPEAFRSAMRRVLENQHRHLEKK
jgi:hypothetical protein